MNRIFINILLSIQLVLCCCTAKAQTTISPLVGESIRAFRNNEFETAREKADRAILSGNYSMNQRRDLYYIRGYGYFLASNYTEALKDFDMVLDIKMNDKQSQLLKAECYYYMNKFDPAILEFNNAEKLWKSSDDNYNNMAAYIRAMRGKCQYKLGKYEIAMEELSHSMLLDSTVMDTWETFGDLNFTLKNFDTSIYYYSKAIELYAKNNDNSIYAWIWRGKVYDSLNNQDAALLNFKQAIRIKDFEREPYWLAALSYEKKKNTDSSLIYFQQALARTDTSDFDNIKLLNREIGLMYKKNNNFDEAIKYFQKALAIDDHYKEAYAEMADCFVELKQYNQSIEPYERAIICYQVDKKDSLILSSIYLKLGDVYNKTKNVAKAKENFLSALKWNKGNNGASMNQANVLYANKKYKEAIPFFKKVIDNPTASEPIILQEAYYKQGMCYLDSKDTTQALESLKKSVEFNTIHDEAQVKLSEIYLARKQFDNLGGLLNNLDSSTKKFDTATLVEMYYRKGVSELASGNAIAAKADFTKSVNFNGNNKKAFLSLAKADMETNDYSGAEEAFTRCLDLYKNEKDSLYKMYIYRGQARCKQNKFTDAVDDIEAANHLKPNNPAITKSLIETNIAAGRFEKALELIGLFQKTLKTTDLINLATTYYYRAQCNIGLSNTDKALNDLAKAITYNHNYPEAQKLIDDLNGGGLPKTATASTDSTAKESNNTSGTSIAMAAVKSPVTGITIPKGIKGSKGKKGKKTPLLTNEVAKTDSSTIANAVANSTDSSNNKESNAIAGVPVTVPVAVNIPGIVSKKVSKKDKKGKKVPEINQEVAKVDSSTTVSVPAIDTNKKFEPKNDTINTASVVAKPGMMDTLAVPTTTNVEPVIAEPKKDTVVAPPAVTEPVKKDTVVVPTAPKVEPVIAEPKKDTVVAPPVVAEPVKKDTVIVPTAPKVELIIAEPKRDTVVAPPVVTEPVKKDTVVVPPAPKVEPVIAEPKKDTVVAPPVVTEPVKKDTVVVPPAPKVEPVIPEPKKDTVVAPPVVAEPVKKDTVVVTPAPKVEPVIAEPKKDTIVGPPVVTEPLKKDTVIVPPAPKIEPVIAEPKKDTVVAPPVVAEPVKKDTVFVPPAPKVEPVIAEPKKDTVVAPPVITEPVKKDTVVVPAAPKVEPVIAEPKKDTVVAPPVVTEHVKKDTVVVPTAPKVEPVIAEPKKDTVVAPPVVAEPVKKDTVVVPPAPKVEPVIAEPKKDTVAKPVSQPVETIKKDTTVSSVVPKVEPVKNDSTVQSIIKTDSAKVEINKDSTLPKETKKDQLNQLLNNKEETESDERKNNHEIIKPSSNEISEEETLKSNKYK